MSKLTEFEATIEARGGEQALFDRLATTEELVEIAKDYGVSLRTLDQWRKASEERQTEWAEARSVASHAFAAESRRVLADLRKKHTQEPGGRPKERLESAWVALANNESAICMKRAAALNPAVYGDRPSTVINNTVSIGLQHLQALTKYGSMSAIAPKSEVIPEAEYTIEEKTA